MKIHPVADVTVPVVLEDRRRPGRVDDASPELIDLLRGSGGGGLLSPLDNDDTSPLSASRGIKVAIMLSASIWALAIVLTVWLLR
jgi:hypothetical protein